MEVLDKEYIAPKKMKGIPIKRVSNVFNLGSISLISSTKPIIVAIKLEKIKAKNFEFLKLLKNSIINNEIKTPKTIAIPPIFGISGLFFLCISIPIRPYFLDIFIIKGIIIKVIMKQIILLNIISSIDNIIS
jgi:hypothetical protein